MAIETLKFPNFTTIKKDVHNSQHSPSSISFTLQTLFYWREEAFQIQALLYKRWRSMIFFHPPIIIIIIVIPQYKAWHVFGSFIWGKSLFKFKTLNLFSNSNLLMMRRRRRRRRSHPRSSSLIQLGRHKQIPKSAKNPFLHDLIKICGVIKM